MSGRIFSKEPTDYGPHSVVLFPCAQPNHCILGNSPFKALGRERGSSFSSKGNSSSRVGVQRVFLSSHTNAP